MGQSIAKNTSIMTLASIGQKVVAFFYFTLIARMIGAEDLGRYFFSLSFVAIFVIFIDLGITNVLIREGAKMRDKIQTYFSTIISTKLVLAMLVYVVVVVTIQALGYPAQTRQLVYLAGITMIFDSFHITMYGILRALGDLRFEAIGIVCSQILTLIMGISFLLFDLPLIYLILAFTIPSILNACFVCTMLYRKYHIRFVPQWNKKVFVYLFRITVPFALAGIFARVYSYIDSMLLSRILGDIAVGLYAIPYKIAFAFQFIPIALIATVYPRFSTYFVEDSKKLARTFEHAITYLLLIAFPVAVGIGVLSSDIILLLYTSEYAGAIVPLQVLMSSIIFSFISFPIGALLNACNRQATQTKIVGSVLLINIVLNLILIPKTGVAGAAISALVGNVLLSGIGFVFVSRITSLNYSYLLTTLSKIALSAVVMGGVVWYVNTVTHFLFAILVGIVIYPVMIYSTQVIKPREYTTIRQVFKQ